jgi:hypothetical protein
VLLAFCGTRAALHAPPELLGGKNLSGNLLVQLGLATEDLNRRWYEANSGQVIADVHRRMGATLDGRVEATGAVFGEALRFGPIWKRRLALLSPERQVSDLVDDE